MRQNVVMAALLALALAGLVFSQGGNAQLGGVVSDPSGALMPGVTITVTNTDTGVVNTTISNESGAYNFPSLLPGRAYRASASLPGFQTKTVTNLELGTAVSIRQDFQMQISTQATTVEVSVEANQLLTTASQSVGEVLSQNRVRDLPLVGGNVLDLVTLMAGVRGEGNTANFAGVGAGQINTVRDGLSVSDGRFVNGVFGTTIINPDLVGEIRVILSPVDAEMGRGNGQVQIQTRSGTNRYTGAAVWNVRNSALNPNTWGNNNDIDPVSGQWSPTQPNWFNNHQYTVSFGGPIIHNKTFFYALWDQQLNYQRNIVTGIVMTDEARKGIFRYFTGYNNGHAEQNETTGAAATIATVDFTGKPKTPQYAPRANGTAPLVPYTGALNCISVFGNVKADGSSFGAADCPGGVAITTSTAWDPLRPVTDPTGYVAKILEKMPHANFFGNTGGGSPADGLNIAAYRYLRVRNGNTGANVTTGLDTDVNRKQFNLKIDHNFSQSHKLAVSWTKERNDSANDVPNWPDGISYTTKRYPQVLTANFTSTLSASLLNEARFGIRYNRAGVDAPWEDQYGNKEIQDQAKGYMLKGSNGYEALVSLGAGNYQFGGSANGVMNTNPGQYNGNISPLYNYADTVSWTLGKHAFKFGGELRYTKSKAYSNIGAGSQIVFNSPRLTGGAGGNTSPLNTATTALPAANLLTTNRTNATNMLYFLAASINQAQMVYWIDDSSDVTNGKWEDVTTIPGGRKFRETAQNEYSGFAKDDWKVSKNVTLNLGLRYDYYGSPWITSGFTSTLAGLGDGLFGVAAPGSGDVFSNWMKPGNIYLTGYGPNASAATALTCANGVTQSAALPVSNCDPAKITKIEFVGPKTPNPNKFIKPPDKNNFGPAVGFSWNVPWFGEAHSTTVRGGYQITFGGSGRNVGGGFANTLETVAGGAAGALTNATTIPSELTSADIGADRYLDLRDVAKLVPVKPTNPAVPGGALAIYGRTVNPNVSAYDANYVDPYTQNFNLSVTTNLTRKVTMDLRYIGTVSRKQESQLNPNTVNIFYNKELFDALEVTRAGGNSPLLDQMLAGLSFFSTATTGYGPIGTCVVGVAGAPGAGLEGCPAGQVLQHASAHLRRTSATQGVTLIRQALANGDYNTVAQFLNGNGSSMPAVGAAGGLLNLPTGVVGVGGRLLRNGCDRLGNGQATVGANLNLPLRCFAENYLVANPQMNAPTLLGNITASNYHSVQTQFTLRPTAGLSWQGTYTFSKNLGTPASGYTNPADRNLDYGPTNNDRRHDFRMNGTFELPVGPNKLLFGNSSGWIARAIERWQTGLIFNWNSGAWSTIGATSTLYANGTADIVGAFPIKGGKATWGYAGPNNTLVGDYFSPGTFTRVEDPQCSQVVNRTDSAGYNPYTAGDCTIDAIADANGNVLLKNAKPGTNGTLGRFTYQGLGSWDFDANVSKTFRITESKSLQVRIDTTNVLNHPNVNNPTIGVNGDTSNTPFGRITGKGNDTRTFQGQLRLTF